MKCFFIHLFSAFLHTDAVEKYKSIRHCLISLSILHSPGTLEAEFTSELDVHSEAFQRCCHNESVKLGSPFLFHFIFLPWKISIIHIELSRHPFKETRFQECKTVNKESKIFLLVYLFSLLKQITVSDVVVVIYALRRDKRYWQRFSSNDH